MKAAQLIAAFLVLTWTSVPAQETPTPETLALFDYHRELPLNIEESDVKREQSHTRIDLSYESPAGGRVGAYLYVPEAPGPHAGLLLMHGMPGNREQLDILAVQYVARGAVVLVIDAPFARDIDRRRDPVTFTAQDRHEQIQLIQDLRRGVDLLLQRPDVDPDRIGYLGGSYGGAMGGLLAGVEHRIRAYVLFNGDGGLVTHFTGPEDAGGPLDKLPEEQRDAWLKAMNPIEPIRFIGSAAPSHLLLQFGREDRLVPPADAEAYGKAASEPKTIQWYDMGHGLNSEMIEDQVEWLASRIAIRPTARATSPTGPLEGQGDHEFVGRYGGVRSITFDGEQLFLQRDGSIKMKLVLTENNLWRMELPEGVAAGNTLPLVRFDRDENGQVSGLTFVHADGREEPAAKDP
jgi:dienelactone hydrolase